MGVSASASRGQPGVDGRQRHLDPLERFERAGLVKVVISVVGVDGDGFVVPRDGGFVIARVGVFLGDPVQAEGVVGLRLQHREESGESVGLSHAGILHRISAGYNQGGSSSPKRWSGYAPDMPHLREDRSSPVVRRRVSPVSTRLILLAVGVLLGCGLQTGCDSGYAARQTIDLRPRIVEIQDHHGGTRRISLIHQDEWYQSFGPSIEIIDPEDGLRISTIDIGPFGTVPPISDLRVCLDGNLYAVYANDRVVRFDLQNARRPVAVRTWTAEELGFRPVLLSEAGGEIWVSGRGGVISLRDSARPRLTDLPDEAMLGRVVEAPEGLLLTNGRRVIAMEDGRYLGAASDLQRVPRELSDRIGWKDAYVFILRGDKATTVGLMGPDIRELDSEVFPYAIWKARVLGDRLWAVGEDELVTWKIDDDGHLVEPQFVPIKGARDIAMLRDNYYAVAGTFGRAIYRFKADAGGAADEFLAVERSPGRVVQAITDGRRVLAGSEEGNWLYRIGGKMELSEKDLQTNTRGTRSLTLGWGEVSIDDTSKELTILPLGAPEFTWSPSNGGRIFTLETAADRVWVGHDGGVDVFEFKEGKVVSTGSIVVEGPVVWLFRPRVGDKVAFVSAFGGIGTAEVVPDPGADEALVRRVRPEEAVEAEGAMREAGGLAPLPDSR